MIIINGIVINENDCDEIIKKPTQIDLTNITRYPLNLRKIWPGFIIEFKNINFETWFRLRAVLLYNNKGMAIPIYNVSIDKINYKCIIDYSEDSFSYISDNKDLTLTFLILEYNF
jgi:hypothetical protein